MKLITLVETWERVRSTSSRKEKASLLAEIIRQAGTAHVGLAVAYLSGNLPQGRIGIGPSTLGDARTGEAAASPTLRLAEVDQALQRIEDTSGTGSTAARASILGRLLARGTPSEQRFLVQLLFGELRQGANEGVMIDAVARASGVGSSAVRRAAMLSGDLPEVAARALAGGAPALADFDVRLFRPVQPMLASSAESPEDAFERLDRAAVEYKLDGARVQVHKSGSDVRVFSRHLRDVTRSVPELVEAVASLPARELVLDGETLVLAPGGRPEPFQTTMRRFGRKLDVTELQDTLPLTSFFFDCIRIEGQSLIDAGAEERHRALLGAVPEALRIPRTLADSVEGVATVLARARAAGHEGVVVKDLSAPYAAGSRGRAWRKLKTSHTLDLVVLAAEWGHGRRRGWLSNLHLGARDETEGGFAMLGKTFKGLTDEMLMWQTERLQELEVARDRHTVYVEPRLVVEVSFNDVQASPRYPAGLALRFARVKAYRPDKDPAQADTVDTVRRIHGASLPGRKGRDDEP